MYGLLRCVEIANCRLRLRNLADGEEAFPIAGQNGNVRLRFTDPRPRSITIAGRRVKLRTRDKRLRGEVLAADAQNVRLGFDETTTDVPYDQIVRANLIDEG